MVQIAELLGMFGMTQFVIFCAVFIAPAALMCLWMLASDYTGVIGFPGGWLGMYGVIVAPWQLAVAGGILLVSAALRYGYFRINPENRRKEKALGVKPPAPRMLKIRFAAGLASVLLAALVLAPQYMPSGVLIGQSAKIESWRVFGTGRRENGEFVYDYADQKILYCRYITLHGVFDETIKVSAQFTRCPYFRFR